MGEVDAGQDEFVERPRRRKASEGRLVVHVSNGTGLYICEQAEDLGITAPTFARMLIVEALKARGLTPKMLDEQYPVPNYAPDKRRTTGPRIVAAQA